MKEKGKNTKIERKKRVGARYSESVKAKEFCCAFKLDFA